MRSWIVRYWLVAVLLLGGISSVYYTYQQSASDARDSVQRSVDACRRENPTRAYFQLRARQLQPGSATAKRAALAFEILDCRDTVRLGRPVALNLDLQRRYRRDFARGRIDLTRGQAIIGSVSFHTYFVRGLVRP